MHTLSANTTLNKIIVGISLLGEGSVLETCKEKKTNLTPDAKSRQAFILKCQFTVCYFAVIVKTTN